MRFFCSELDCEAGAAVLVCPQAECIAVVAQNLAYK